MSIQLYWVMGYLRSHVQSAKHALIYSLCRELKSLDGTVKNHLVVTNETAFPALRVSSIDSIIENLKFWLPRIGGDIADISLYFDSLTVVPPEKLRDFADNLRPQEREFFIFNSSLPSERLSDYLTEKKFKTIYMPAAPEAVYKARRLMFLKGLSEPVFVKERMNIFGLAPCFGVFLMGKSVRSPSRAKLERRTLSGASQGKITVVSSAESLFERFSQQDWDNVILPLLGSNKNLHWVFIAPPKANRDGPVESTYGFRALSNAGLVGGGQQRVHIFTNYIGEIFEFFEQNADIYYKGFHEGGATTVAGAIHRGVPVVDYSFSDSQSFLERELLLESYDSARDKLQQLIGSLETRIQVARSQKESLDRSNQKSARYFMSVLHQFMLASSQN